MQKEIYRVKDFCEHFSIPRSSLYLEIAAGRIRILKCGRKTFITHDEGKRWIKTITPYKPEKCRPIGHKRRRKDYSVSSCAVLIIRKSR
jgi:hypothetical protein